MSTAQLFGKLLAGVTCGLGAYYLAKYAIMPEYVPLVFATYVLVSCTVSK